MERASRASTEPRLSRWIEREGIDLKVEWHGPGGWEKVGLVKSVGPLALRHVVVPLPDMEADPESSLITLRVSGGSGFWKIDQIGLSAVIDEQVNSHSIAPSLVKTPEGADELELVSAVDGNYQILANMSDRVSLKFDPPPVASGMIRSAFFQSNGYYLAHEPIQNKRSISTFKTILNEEGALARFSLDLFRKYYELCLNTPRRPGSFGGGS